MNQKIQLKNIKLPTQYSCEPVYHYAIELNVKLVTINAGIKR